MEPGSSAAHPVLEFSSLAAYEWLSTPAWVYDPDEFRHWWANAAGLSFWRSPNLDELRTRSYADSTEAARARNRLAMQAHARGETTSERWTLYPRDVPVSIILQGTAIRLPDGRIGLLYMAELATQIEPSLMRAIEALQHTGVLVAIHHQHSGVALMRNTAASLAFGAIVDGAPTNDLASIFPDPALPAAVLARVAVGGRFEADLELRTLQGPVWYHFEAGPARDPVTGDAAVQINATDISRLVQLQRELESAKARAEAASESKSQFLSNMSHELRTPINGMIPVLNLLARTPLQAQQRRWVDLMLQSTQALTVVLSDVLELAGLDSGAAQNEPVDFEPHAELVQALQPFAMEAERKHLQLAWQFAPSVPPRLRADLRRIRQVVLNLVANAVKFTDEGRVSIQFDIAADAAVGQVLRIVVEDTGIGMSAEALQTIYHPFTQADASSTRRHGGCGIGLTIVHHVLALLGGRIDVTSAPGQGSRFTVTVPVAPASG